MNRRKALLVIGGISLLPPGYLLRGERRIRMKKEIKTQHAPEAIGPYSQAIVADGFVFASGQIAIDPATGQLLEGDISVQTRQVLTNMKAVLEAAGSSLEKAVKCTVFLADMDDYQEMNSVYGKFFKSPFPARAAVQVARLPKGVKVEIETIAVV